MGFGVQGVGTPRHDPIICLFGYDFDLDAHFNVWLLEVLIMTVEPGVEWYESL